VIPVAAAVCAVHRLDRSSNRPLLTCSAALAWAASANKPLRLVLGIGMPVSGRERKLAPTVRLERDINVGQQARGSVSECPFEASLANVRRLL
jgi:hypothetical protein